jgi:uncharacterized membrane protein YhfC
MSLGTAPKVAVAIRKQGPKNMTTYFQDGGYAMWLILIIALGSTAVAVASKAERRSKALWLGSYGSLVAGVFGMSAGMVAVSRNISRFADKGAAVAQGLGELSNNGSFAAILAVVLAVAALITAPTVTARQA